MCQSTSSSIKPQSFSSSNDEVQLKLLYQITTLLSVMMVVWILWLPGSMWIGQSKIHDEFLAKHLAQAMETGVVTPETLSKFEGHTAVHLTHLLPGAVWSAAIPFQLHRGFRTEQPVLHRWMGYAFFASSFLMTIGILIILHRDLYFENFFDDLPPLKFSTEPTQYINVVLFLGSSANALRLARARQFFDHQVWVIRHMASGLWIAVQRVLLVAVFTPLLTQPIARSTKRMSFIVAGFAGMAISWGCGEYAIYLLRQERVDKSQQKKKCS